jgi:hypothetical protein
MYPQGIIKSEIILININSPSVKEVNPTDIIFFVISVVVFSIIGVLFVYYIYNISKLKEKMKRLRS